MYDIKPIYVLAPEKRVRINPEDYKIHHKQRTAVKLTREQYKNLVAALMGIGEPKFEAGVISLFSKMHRELGFSFLKLMRDKYPDCIAEKQGKDVRIEFERRSSDFENQDHNPEDCDYIVCWTDDLGALAPIEVIELKEAIYGH